MRRPRTACSPKLEASGREDRLKRVAWAAPRKWRTVRAATFNPRTQTDTPRFKCMCPTGAGRQCLGASLCPGAAVAVRLGMCRCSAGSRCRCPVGAGPPLHALAASHDAPRDVVRRRCSTRLHARQKRGTQCPLTRAPQRAQRGIVAGGVHILVGAAALAVFPRARLEQTHRVHPLSGASVGGDGRAARPRIQGLADDGQVLQQRGHHLGVAHLGARREGRGYRGLIEAKGRFLLLLRAFIVGPKRGRPAQPPK
eukprot:scaffold14362_cov142-Isochrysis_galbana.AAC.1